MIHCLTNDPSLSPNEVFIEEEQHPRSHGRECKTRFSFNAEFDGCLTVQKGECLILCRHNNDGWSLGKSDLYYRLKLLQLYFSANARHAERICTNRLFGRVLKYFLYSFCFVAEIKVQ